MNLGEPIAKGNTANIYLHDGKVIKVFNDFLPDTEAEYEAQKQRHAYSCGLSVPCVHEVIKINGKQAIVMEHILGKVIGNIIYDDMTKAEQYISLSVDIQMKIHEIKTDGLELMADKLSRRLKTAFSLSITQKNALLEKLNGIQYEKRLCHGDYHVFNLIMKDNDVVIIDWVDSSAGDLRADVYRTYLLYSQFSMDLATLYLRLYCEKSGLSQADIFIWEPIIAGARLSENVSSENAERLIDIVRRFCPV